jgi:hypothetical protein
MFSVSPPGIGGHRTDTMPPVITREISPTGRLLKKSIELFITAAARKHSERRRLTWVPDPAVPLSFRLLEREHERFIFAAAR